VKKTLFVSFSGGRTSAYMVWWLLNNKAAEYDLRFVFANTGLEHEKTLDFVHRCDQEWGLNLTWVEAVVSMVHGVGITHKVVDYKTAARKGEPFEQFIRFAGVPNAAFNQCSERLKAMPMEHYRKMLGFKRKHPTAIGIRPDEVDRMSPTAEINGLVYPLITMHPDNPMPTKEFMRHWWDKQDFDLDLPEHYGNCVTCWKKSDRKLMTIAKHEPEYFEFFDRMEREHSTLKCDEKPRYFFRRHRATQDILAASKLPFKEFVDHMPELQLGMFDPMDMESDCGAESCEIQ